MTIDTGIILAGAFVAVVPFLGFPASWDTVLFFLAGILILSLGVVIRRRRTEAARRGARESAAQNTRPESTS